MTHQRVVVIAEPETADAALAALHGARAERLVLVVPGPGPDSEHGAVSVRHRSGRLAVHRAVAEVGPVDVLIDLRRGDPATRFRRWRQLFFHLVDGGVHALPAVLPGDTRDDVLLSRLRALAAPPGSTDAPPPRHRELARAVVSVEQRGEALLVSKRRSHLLKLHQDGVESLIEARGTGLDVLVLDRRPGGVLHPERTHTSAPASIPRLLDDMPYPPAVLRRYLGPVDLLRGMLAHHGGVLLPETFKWHLQDDLHARRLVKVDRHFARLRRVRRQVEELEGSYYYFDYNNPGHYGHLLVEAVAKLWGWERARELDPDLKLLIRRRRRDARQPRPDLAILGAYGIEESDMVWFDRGARVRSLVGATPMLHAKEPYHAHPDLVEVWGRIRAGLLAQVPRTTPPGPRRIFISRRTGRKNRPCRNTAEVEQLFAEAGFEIVFPEKLPLPMQAALFDGADVVAGFGGSGMFGLIYTARSPVVIVLAHDAYDARNEHLITALLGSDVHYFWSPADVRPARPGKAYRAFQSSWAFDFEANGDALRSLLRDELPADRR